MQESHLCVSKAADHKVKLLEFTLMGNNSIGWRAEGEVLMWQ